MDSNEFFPPHEGVSLRKLAAHLGAELLDASAGDRIIRSVAPLSRAGEGQLCYLRSRKDREELASCRASAILCDASLQSLIPDHIAVLRIATPHTAFAQAGALLHPVAMRPSPFTSQAGGIHPSAFVDPTARLEPGVEVEPMAVIGARAEIGTGTRIGAGALVGSDVKIGRDCTIAGGASVVASLIGNGVIIHNGARIGQDGFGYAPGPAGMLKIVQIGRVIIQDDVEIGANTTIDRGALDDTVIGEGSKIDNLVQVGHNVRIGRGCVIAGHCGISGSVTIGDYAMLGGGAGIRDHLQIGAGAQIAGRSAVMEDVPAGAKWAGSPAQPVRAFFREVSVLRSLSNGGKDKSHG